MPAELDAGEQAAVALAHQRKLPLLIEERAGRRACQRRKLRFSGIAGQVSKAYREELISAEQAERFLLELYQANRIHRDLYDGLARALRQRRARGRIVRSFRLVELGETPSTMASCATTQIA